MELTPEDIRDVITGYRTALPNGATHEVNSKTWAYYLKWMGAGDVTPEDIDHMMLSVREGEEAGVSQEAMEQYWAKELKRRIEERKMPESNVIAEYRHYNYAEHRQCIYTIEVEVAGEWRYSDTATSQQLAIAIAEDRHRQGHNVRVLKEGK